MNPGASVLSAAYCRESRCRMHIVCTTRLPRVLRRQGTRMRGSDEEHVHQNIRYELEAVCAAREKYYRPFHVLEVVDRGGGDRVVCACCFSRRSTQLFPLTLAALPAHLTSSGTLLAAESARIRFRCEN